MSDESVDVFRELADLEARHDQLHDLGHMRSALRVAQEQSRLSRQHGLVVPYLGARFKEMNRAGSVFDPELGCQVAVELVALLESEDRARLIEPELPEDEYALTVGWMLSCAYDNLAEHTAQQQGYNSPGMQACISSGIEVCRRTGKLECINCFRTYATKVYRAADDLDMALHSARLVGGLADDAPGSYRRWSGARDETLLLLLQGHIEAAAEVSRRCLDLAPAYHNPLRARRETTLLGETVGMLAGTLAPDPGTLLPRELPPGEDVELDLAWDLRDAIAAVCRCDYALAETLLVRWDQWLRNHHCLHEWFEVRLRLAALARMTGNERRLRSLADPLRDKAREACDWLTLRRLDRVLDAANRPVPIPLTGDLQTGPFAVNGSRPVDSGNSPVETGSAGKLQSSEGPPESPLAEAIGGFSARLSEADGAERVVRQIAEEMLAMVPPTVAHPFDAGWLLHLMQFALGSGIDLAAVWQWARRIAELYPQDPRVLNTYATLAAALSVCDQPPAGLPAQDEIEALFRQSLDLDPTLPRNFARAGVFYLQCDRLDDAERCLSRAFRLDRASAPVASQLADMYERSERPRDALAVLDLALREGCDEPQIAWQAAMLAFETSQHEALLTYLDRFESQRPGEAVTNYYRAMALIELRDPVRASLALDEEERRNPIQPLPVAILRACLAAERNDLPELERRLQDSLVLRLSQSDYLSIAGFTSLYNRLWRGVRRLPDTSAEKRQLVSLLLESGLAPELLFADLAPQGSAVDGVGLYRCLIWQPLDHRWRDSAGCLPGQEDWTFYSGVWGVLARSEDEARRLVLEWQQHCAPLPAECREVELTDRDFIEVPRVVWQGARINVDLSSLEFENDDEVSDESPDDDDDAGDA